MDSNGLGMILIILGLIVYFLPTIISGNRGHPNSTPIALLNIFLGWTLVGWVVALVWATSAIKVEAPPENVQVKPCPFCAEPVRFEAVKCKHCGSDLNHSTA